MKDMFIAVPNKGYCDTKNETVALFIDCISSIFDDIDCMLETPKESFPGLVNAVILDFKKNLPEIFKIMDKSLKHNYRNGFFSGNSYIYEFSYDVYNHIHGKA